MQIEIASLGIPTEFRQAPPTLILRLDLSDRLSRGRGALVAGVNAGRPGTLSIREHHLLACSFRSQTVLLP